MTRPLCPYPQQAVYKGSGSISSLAHSPSCAAIEKTRLTLCNESVQFEREYTKCLNSVRIGPPQPFNCSISSISGGFFIASAWFPHILRERGQEGDIPANLCSSITRTLRDHRQVHDRPVGDPSQTHFLGTQTGPASLLNVPLSENIPFKAIEGAP